MDSYLDKMSQFFQNSPLYQLLTNIGDEFKLKNFNKSLLDSYIYDFLLINCQISFSDELGMAAQLLDFEIDQALKKHRVENPGQYLTSLSHSLPIVHYVYDQCKLKIEIYLSMTRFEWRLTSEKFEWSEIHLDACLRLLELFKIEFIFATTSFNRLFVILQLLSQYLLANFGFQFPQRRHRQN